MTCLINFPKNKRLSLGTRNGLIEIDKGVFTKETYLSFMSSTLIKM